MSYVLFLNELSFGACADRWAADASMAEFDKLLRKFFEWNDDTSLADHIGLDSIELSPGYSFREWINADRRNKERWNFIRLRRTKAPFRDKNLDLPGDVEYKYSAQAVRGLGLADHYYGLCVSLRVSDVWDSPHISVDRLALDEGAARSPEVTPERREVLHSSTCENADSHRDRWQPPESRLPVMREGRRLRHLRFGVMVECLERKYFYSVDHARHGDSAVKRFVEQADALYWDADLDTAGNPIENKHKSDVGMRIPKNELHAV